MSNFFGRPRRTLQGKHLALSERVYAANTRTARHAHENPYLCLVLSGGFLERSGTTDRDCSIFDVITNPIGKVHADYFGTESRTLNIEIGPEILQRVHESDRFVLPEHSRGGPLSWLGLQLYLEYLRRDSLWELAAESLLMEMLSDALDPPRPVHEPPAWLLLVRDAVNENFRERLLLEDLARLGGVHVVHLARTFRRYYGTTVAGHIRRLRIDSACRALALSDMLVSDVAADLGFSDQSHLTHALRECIGLAPARFRSIYRAHELSRSQC